VETSRTRYSIVLSAAIQLVLGAFTAHPYDGRVFLAVGYSVAHGSSPYVPANVSEVFGRSLFPKPVPGIGYPPPWSLMLSLCYLLSYNLFHNLILYNLAVKVPVIIGNILLALLVGKMVLSENSDAILSERATRFMLFNPYVIYTTAIWGQFDTVSVFLMLLSVFELTRSRRCLSAAVLGGAIALKVIPVVLFPLLLLHESKRGGWRRAFEYSVPVLAVVGLSFTPFLLGWSITPIVENWNVHFLRVGAFSPMSILLLFGINLSTEGLDLLGYLWLPSLMLIYYVLSKRSITKPSDLILAALAIMLGLSLTRSWVSEQNLNFVLPLVLLASIAQGWSKRWVAATWVLPLIFAFLNAFPLLMLFLVAPESVLQSVSPNQLLLDVGRMALVLITTIWLIIGLGVLRKSIGECGASTRPRKSDPSVPRDF